MVHNDTIDTLGKLFDYLQAQRYIASLLLLEF